MNTVDRIRDILDRHPNSDAEALMQIEDLKDLLSSNAEELCAVVEAAENLEVISSGSGPAAPIFDQYDYMVERNRGRWHTIDGATFDELKKALRELEKD